MSAPRAAEAPGGRIAAGRRPGYGAGFGLRWPSSA